MKLKEKVEQLEKHIREEYEHSHKLATFYANDKDSKIYKIAISEACTLGSIINKMEELKIIR